MKKSANTERALVLSMVSMLLCMIMLVGTTFAWFEDTSTANISIISIGQLGVSLENEAGQSLTSNNGGVTTFGLTSPNELKFVPVRNADGTELALYALDPSAPWVPGLIYELENIYVVNDGDINLKYKLGFNGLNYSTEMNSEVQGTILDVISFTVKIYNVTENPETHENIIEAEPIAIASLNGDIYKNSELYKAELAKLTGQLVPGQKHMVKVSAQITNEATYFQGSSFSGLGIVVSATQINGEITEQPNEVFSTMGTNYNPDSNVSANSNSYAVDNNLPAASDNQEEVELDDENEAQGQESNGESIPDEVHDVD